MSNRCIADNPIIQHIYTGDPAPMVYKDRVYLYIGHDEDNAPDNAFLMKNYHCFSTIDMVNWTHHGSILETKSVSWSGGDASAAQAIFRNGKFYFYISTQGPGGVSIGAMVSNSPTGPFKDTLGNPLIAGSLNQGCNATHGWRGLDPTVFIDTDNQAYMYWGNNVLYWVKLNENMISLSGTVSCLPQNDPAFGPDFEEAPWIYKYNDIYYLIYASQIPEKIRYSTSLSPTGPWTYRGNIMLSPLKHAGSNHPGMIEYKGKNYYFYHDASLPNGQDHRRSVCVEEFNYNADGMIPEIPATKDGPVAVDTLNPYDTIQAETICWESGIETDQCNEGGMMVDSIHNGDYIKVKGVDFASGAKSFFARIASANSGGKIELHLDSPTGTLVGSCTVSSTNGWQNWATVSCTVSGATGIHDLYLKFTGGSGQLFNFNWWKFDSPITTVELKAITNYNKLKVTMSYSCLTIDFAQMIEGNVNISLIDLYGRTAKKLFSGTISSHCKFNLNKANLQPGTYLMKLSGNKFGVLSKKIVLF
jgi:hypothetical protein